MFNRDVMSITDLVDGISSHKIYTAIHIELKDDCVYYGVIDDYGMYGLYKQDKFMTVTKQMINSIIEYESRMK